VLTAEQTRQFQQADANLDRLTVRQVLALLTTLNVDAQRDFIEGLMDSVPGIVAELGDVSALVSSSMYELAREQAEARGRFTVNLADPPGVKQVQESVKWAFSPLFYADLERAVAVRTVTDRLVAATPRLVREGGRQTITENTRRDPAKPKYRRVLSIGSGHCDFCVMLSGRGSVYWSEDSAGSGRHFHDNCHCTVQLEF
jgi:hypothetical protein